MSPPPFAPPDCGEWAAARPLAPLTWLRAGGAAQWFVRIRDEASLQALLRRLPQSVPLLVLGAGSNLLVRDGGVPGLVVRLGRGFQQVEVLSGARLAAGAAMLDAALARAAHRAGIAGLEFLSRIPGTLGGALAMNAGAHGAETAELVQQVEAYDRAGKKHVLTRKEMRFAYRHCGAARGMIFTKAILGGKSGASDKIAARLAEIEKARALAQPGRVRTGGSTFKNPGGADGQKAWPLIDAAGGRGLRIGQAQMSEKHCNFMVNLGGARAQDLERLGEEVRARVRAQSGCDLEWELHRVGEHTGQKMEQGA